MNTTPTRNALSVLSIAAAALLMTACNKPDDSKTAGQKLDETIAKTEQRADDMKAKTEAAVDKAVVSVEDAGITASIKAELAKDPALSALSIKVETKEGLVQLNGSAPDSASRERATRLAAAVKGVLSVDNKLVVNS